MQTNDRTAITYRYDRLRALASGVIEAAAGIFLLLVAVRYFHAGPFAKAAIAGGGSAGLILAPWLVSRVASSGVPVSQAAARITAASAITFLIMAAVPVLWVYVAGSVIAMAATSAIVPLVTQIYQENYQSHDRGRRFARAMMIRIATAAAFSEIGGRMLSGHIGWFRWLLLVFAASSAFASFCLARCPSRPLTVTEGTHPFRALRFFRDDRLFRQTLIAWMFLGFALLMMAPLRVEYLANPRYGVTWKGDLLTAGTVALLTGVIPNVARLLCNPIWGWLFDKMNFFILRLCLNVAFMAGILSFFVMGSITGLVIGAVLFGVANGGGDVAWSLWVTKFAPAERVADYMSVHTFFTGVRGVLAPVAAFYVVSDMPLRTLGWVSVGMIIIGSCFLIPEVRYGRTGRKGADVLESAAD